MRFVHRLAVLGFAGSLATAAAAVPRWTFEAIAPPPGALLSSQGLLTDAGQVAAVWARPGASALEATWYTPGAGHAAIGPTGFDTLELLDANAAGTVVGYAGPYDRHRAWQLAPTSGPLPGLGSAIRSSAQAVSAAGVVVGYQSFAHGQSEPWVARPGGLPQPIAGLPDSGAAIDINDRGEVLLAGLGGPGFSLYRHDLATGTTTRVAGDEVPTISRARINDAGQIGVTFGWRFTEAGVFGADGSFTRLAGLPGFADQAFTDLNDRGQVLGVSYNAERGIPFDRRDFLYTPGAGTVDPLSDADLPAGWTDVQLVDLAADGDLLGSGTVGGERRLFYLHATAAPVPEPAAALLALLGAMGAVAGAGVRRRQAAASAAAC